MANTKISALTAATTPLAGTEVLPVVQGGATKQVAVSDLTAGRAVSAASLTLTTTPLAATSGGTGQSSYAVGDLLYASTTTALSKLADVATGNALISGGVGVAPSWGKIGLTTHVSGTLGTGNGGTGLASFTANQVFFASSTSAIGQSANFTWDGTSLIAGGTSNVTAGIIVRQNNSNNGIFQLGSTGKLYQIRGGDYQGVMELFTDAGAGDILFTVANTTRGRMNASGFKPIAGNGIDYSANSAAAGMTSQLLNWYEEGTWTPSLGGTTTYAAQVGRYTRIGRCVYYQFTLSITSIGTGSDKKVSGLPFTSANNSAYGGYAIYYDGVNSNIAGIVGYIDTTNINLVSTTAFANSIGPNSIFKNGTNLTFQGFYFV